MNVLNETVKTRIVVGDVLELRSSVTSFIFLVEKIDEEGFIDPNHGARVYGWWLSHIDKSMEGTPAWMWESSLCVDAWVKIS